VNDSVIDNVKARENNEHTLATYLDLSKAFEPIDHELLINKLEYCGVRGQSLDWFTSYLSDQTQYVQYKGISSDNQCITCGGTAGIHLRTPTFHNLHK